MVRIWLAYVALTLYMAVASLASIGPGIPDIERESAT